jgi:hypothetical protein
MVDPKYYLEAINNSRSFKLALESGSFWISDFLFILYSWFHGVFFNKFNQLTPLIIFFLIYLTVLKILFKTNFKNFFVLIGLFFSSTYFGLIFNVWRQGLAVSFFMFCIVSNYKLIRFSLVGFHLVSLLPIFLLDFLKKKIIKNIFLFSLVIIASFFFLKTKFSYYDNLLLSYGLRHVDWTTSVRLICYCIIFFVSKKIISDSYYNYIFVTLIFSVFLLFTLPGAVERFSHLLHFLIGFSLLSQNSKLKKKDKYNLIISVLLFNTYSVLTFYNSTIVELVFKNIFHEF